MQPPYITQELEKLLESASASHEAIERQVRETEAIQPAQPSAAAEKRLARATEEILKVPERVEANFRQLWKIKDASLEEHRAFKNKRDLDRDGDIPDKSNAVAVCGAGAGIEGTAAGAMYALDGKMGIIQGLGFGLGFGLLNILIGVLIGLFGIRYWSIQVHETFSPAKLRFFARLTTVLGFTALGGLLFTAARVRALGHAQGIFSVDLAGLIGTFNNGFTMQILAIAIIGTAVAIYEGTRKFTDPIPGFSRVQTRVVELDEKGQARADDETDAINHAVDTALDEYEDSLPPPYEHEDYREMVSETLDATLAHNHHIAQVERSLSALSEKDTDTTRIPSTIKAELPGFYHDIDAVKARLTFTEVPASSNILLAQLETARQTALASVSAALMAYQSNTNPFFINERN